VNPLIRFFLLIFVFVLVSRSHCAFAGSGNPDAREVLGRWIKALDAQQKIAFDGVSVIRALGPTDDKVMVTTTRHFRLCMDGEFLDLRDQNSTVDGDGNKMESRILGFDYVDIPATKQAWETSLIDKPVASGVVVYLAPTTRREVLATSLSFQLFLTGRIFGSSGKTVSDLLKSSKELTATRADADTIALKGTGPDGSVSVWISPSQGYNAVRIKVEKRTGDLYDGSPLPLENGLSSWSLVVDPIMLTQVDGVWTPIGGTMNVDVRLKDGKASRTRAVYQRDHIQINPDFAKIGAFSVESLKLTDGIIAEFDQAPDGVAYEYRQGKLVPMIGRETVRTMDAVVDKIERGAVNQPIASAAHGSSQWTSVIIISVGGGLLVVASWFMVRSIRRKQRA
jgi:hypothetical protein